MDGKTESPVGRGALKLRAALDCFELGPALRGVRAVDVGASTGGFTEVMLEHGASHVLCVDVGQNQLHERLRGDPRVRNLESTDWKRLSLSHEAAVGPFDFFTVDVSFVAGRNMLRGLAFRLRPGAHGVVLVKPQFELPDHLVKRGDVNDPALRRQALARFSRKAEGLGFQVVAHVDSPVTGGEGTVEILAHLVFAGRSDKLPLPGERLSERPASASAPPVEPPRTTKERSAGSAGTLPSPSSSPSSPSWTSSSRADESWSSLSRTLDWFAIVAPGVEAVAAQEAKAVLGEGASLRSVAGGLELRGGLEVGMRANLHLRIPTRVLLRMGSLRAREFGKLRHQAARLPWGAFIPAGTPVRLTVSATHCRLYHTGAVEEAVRAAMGDQMGRSPDKPDPSAGDAPLVLVRGVDDVWTLSVDSSGQRLHRRGWRTAGGEAPMRESLAAAALALASWSTNEALVDPMCGAGTIPIEACTVALDMAPGSARAFAFERWPALARLGGARDRWAELQAEAHRARREVLRAPIYASDHDPTSVATTRENAARAGVAAHLVIDRRPLADLEPPEARGLFIANPPYGERLGQRRDLPSLYREIGRVLRQRLPGWRAAVVVPDVRLASAFRLTLVSSHALVHGGLRIALLQFASHADSPA